MTNFKLSNRFQRGADRRSNDNKTDNNSRKDERRKQGLTSLLLFENTDEAEIMPHIADCQVLVLPEGTPLLKPGDNNENVYILLSGKLAAYLDKPNKPEAGMPIKPGECIGEFSAIDGKPVSAWVLVEQSARVLLLPPKTFWQQLLPIPGVTRNLLRTLTDRMRRSNEIMLEVQRKQMALHYLQQELELARQQQATMLPLRQPLFPERQELEMAGMMDPASEIGGDLFDAFFVDEHSLFFCIGDVSGHGIPAALFMARTISLMHISAMGTNRPDQVLERVNNQLCIGNDTNMFVTILCGFLNVQTGELIYSNGGHCPPLLLRQATVVSLPLPKGCLLGVLANNHYQAEVLHLEADDVLVTYTDGVTEAQASNGQQFSTNRLIDVLAENTDLPLHTLLSTIREQVAEFTDNKVLDDDFTLRAIRRTRYQI